MQAVKYFPFKHRHRKNSSFENRECQSKFSSLSNTGVLVICFKSLLMATQFKRKLGR